MHVRVCSTRRHFKNETGVTPPTHRQKRFVQQKMLVSTDGPLSGVQVGYLLSGIFNLQEFPNYSKQPQGNTKIK